MKPDLINARFDFREFEEFLEVCDREIANADTPARQSSLRLKIRRRVSIHRRRTWLDLRSGFVRGLSRILLLFLR